MDLFIEDVAWQKKPDKLRRLWKVFGGLVLFSWRIVVIVISRGDDGLFWGNGMSERCLKERLAGLRNGLLAVIAVAGVFAGGSPSARASQEDCLSYGYACTPGYDATNTEGTWAWTHYGGIYAQNANGYHNCTLYAAWRLEQNGMADPGNWGNAVDWINHTSYNSTPALGSIAWWGSEVASGFGHVAYVDQINGTQVHVIADNYAGSKSDGYTDSGWIPASSVDEFLHPHDLPAAPALVATAPLVITDPSGWYVHVPVGETFTVTNDSGSTMSDFNLFLALRDPYGSNYDQACVNGLTLAPGQSYTCTFSNPWGSVGTYTLWPDWNYAGSSTFHQGQLGPNQTFTLAADPPLAATGSLTITAPSGWFTHVPVHESFTVTNESGSTMANFNVFLALRDPYGANYDQACVNGLTLAPGQSHTCTFSNPWGSVGTYTLWPDWNYAGSSTFHQGQLGPNQTFTLAADPPLAATEPLAITAPHGWYQFAPVDETFTVTNESGATLAIQRLIMALRDPYNANYDQPCATGLTLQPGQSHTCRLHNSWGSAGTYLVWPDWLDYSGNWHAGQLGPDQTFTLAPADTIATPSLPAGAVSKPYTATLAALGGTTPYTWTIAGGHLPAGLTISRSGQLTGTPKTATLARVTIRVTDSSSPALTATRSYTIRIAKARTTTTLRLSARTVSYGHEHAERLSVTVTPQYSGRPPAGKVTIKTAATMLCAITLVAGHGTCHLANTRLRPGRYHLTATYTGNADFDRSASARENLTIAR